MTTCEKATTIRPGSAARAIASMPALGECFLWGTPETTAVFGLRFAISVEGSRVVLVDGNGDSISSTETSDAFADVPALLRRQIGGGFRAYGYLGFGLARFLYPHTRAFRRDL